MSYKEIRDKIEGNLMNKDFSIHELERRLISLREKPIYNTDKNITAAISMDWILKWKK